MNKLLILMGILMISSVYALDNQLTQVCGGDEELVIICLGDEELRTFGYSNIIANITTPGGGGAREEYNETFFQTNYNVTILCSEVNNFLKENKNYTSQEKEDLKNHLAIIFGLAIGDSLLDNYLTDFYNYCPDYKTVEKKKIDYWWLLILILLILILIIIIMIIYDKERLNVILCWIKRDKKEKENKKKCLDKENKEKKEEKGFNKKESKES